MFVNGVKVYQFKAKDSEINAYLFSLVNISQDFTAANIKKSCTIWIHVWFLGYFGNIDVDDITNIPKCLIKKLCNINIWIH